LPRCAEVHVKLGFCQQWLAETVLVRLPIDTGVVLYYLRRPCALHIEEHAAADPRQQQHTTHTIHQTRDTCLGLQVCCLPHRPEEWLETIASASSSYNPDLES
jgi:hypothetical protein